MADEPVTVQPPGPRVASEMSFLSRRPLIGPAAIAVLTLIGTAGSRAHWYFTLMRWVVCPAAVAFATHGASTKRLWAVWVFGGVAVLFNPVVPVHLARTTWQPIDAAAGVAFVVGAVLLKTVSEPHHQTGADPTVP